jgi:phosphonate transport system substrate-binding protein
MAQNAMPFCRALCSYLSSALGADVRLLEDVPWQEAERRLHAGAADVGVVCGLQYVLAGGTVGLSLVAAAVMRGERYTGRPVYFSDVVVRSGSSFGSLADLRGTRWAYNEPTSHSGYNVVRYALAARGERGAYFSDVIASGSHQRSLAMVLAGEVDGAAIDSTVLEQALRDDPRLGDSIRVIETLGPSPIPPLVASRSVDPATVNMVREAVLHMPTTALGRTILHEAVISHFVPVTDADYTPIRQMSQAATHLAPWPTAARTIPTGPIGGMPEPGLTDTS